jgi:hypothetical protein
MFSCFPSRRKRACILRRKSNWATSKKQFFICSVGSALWILLLRFFLFLVEVGSDLVLVLEE